MPHRALPCLTVPYRDLAVSARLGKARLGSARLGWARQGSAGQSMGWPTFGKASPARLGKAQREIRNTKSPRKPNLRRRDWHPERGLSPRAARPKLRPAEAGSESNSMETMECHRLCPFYFHVCPFSTSSLDRLFLHFPSLPSSPSSPSAPSRHFHPFPPSYPSSPPSSPSSPSRHFGPFPPSSPASSPSSASSPPSCLPVGSLPDAP